MANGVIGKVTAAGGTHLIASTAFAVCGTAAATAAKKAYIKDGDGNNASFTLYKGVTVLVQMTNANTASSPTLSVNGTTAKKIVRDDYTAQWSWNSAYSWQAGDVLSFTYDGTYWRISGEPKNAELMSKLSSIASDPPFLNSRDFTGFGFGSYAFLYLKNISFTTNGSGQCFGFTVPELPSSTSRTVRFYPISFIRTNTGANSESHDFIVTCYVRYNESANKVSFYCYDPVADAVPANKEISGILSGIVYVKDES